jgi:prefoldin alpha subunit
MDQELMMKLEFVHKQSQDMEEKLVLVDKQVEELEIFKNNLDTIEKDGQSEILATLGKGVFMKSEIKDKKLYVDVGAGFFVRKSAVEAKVVIEGQVKRLGEIKLQLQQEIERLNADLRRMVEEAEGKK